jgi:tetratricopeptide (TPR) repeat protein
VKQIDNDVIKHLNLSLKIDPAYIPSLFLLAKIYIEKEQFELAKSNLEKIEEIDRENTELLFLKSKLAFKKKDYKRSKEFIDSCFSKKKISKEILQLALDLATIQKNNKNKVMILENWVLYHDPGYEKYLELAKSLDQPNQYEQAKYYFEVAKDLKPKDVNTLVEFARFLYFAKKESKDGSIISKADSTNAKKILSEVLTIKKDLSEALCLLGEIHYHEGNFKKSKEYLKACYEKNYNKSSYLLKLAEIAKISSQPEIQEEFLLEATLDSKNQPKALAELFELKLQTKDKKDALSIGFNAIKSLRRLIRNHRKELDHQLKANNFTESKRITVGIRSSYEMLSDIYFQCSELMKSKQSKIQCIDLSLDFNPLNVSANFQKGILAKNNSSADYITYFKTCIENDWRHWHARWEYVKALEKEMPEEELISHLNTILECNPNHDEAKSFLQRLVSSNS